MAEASDLDGYEYFFHVIYRREDDDKPAHDFTKYVTEYLEKEIAARLDRPIRGYYAARDAKIGSNVITEIVRVIEGSCFTLVVLTEKFIDSTWDTYWQLTAFQERARHGEDRFNKFIAIAFGIDSDKLNKLCKYLKLKEVLYVPREGYHDQQQWQSKLVNALDVTLPPVDPDRAIHKKETRRNESSRLVPSASERSSPVGQEEQPPEGGMVSQRESKQPSSVRARGKGTIAAGRATCHQTENRKEKNSEGHSF